jgi:hypothetical protein
LGDGGNGAQGAVFITYITALDDTSGFMLII